MHNYISSRLLRCCSVATAMLVASFATCAPAGAALHWEWNYAGAGVNAAGTFATVDTPDALGFYLITAISGERNGESITGLQPAGVPIPGNEPFGGDNLVREGTNQLSGDGFGYATSGGHYANPFFASFLPTPGYLEVFSAPPFVPGSINFGPEDSELQVVFSARRVTVTEPATALLLIACVGAGAGLRRLRRPGRCA